MEERLTDEGMSPESDIVYEVLVMEAGLTDEGMSLASAMVTRAW